MNMQPNMQLRLKRYNKGNDYQRRRRTPRKYSVLRDEISLNPELEQKFKKVETTNDRASPVERSKKDEQDREYGFVNPFKHLYGVVQEMALQDSVSTHTSAFIATSSNVSSNNNSNNISNTPQQQVQRPTAIGGSAFEQHQPASMQPTMTRSPTTTIPYISGTPRWFTEINVTR
jgi:hypothetical protein